MDLNSEIKKFDKLFKSILLFAPIFFLSFLLIPFLNNENQIIQTGVGLIYLALFLFAFKFIIDASNNSGSIRKEFLNLKKEDIIYEYSFDNSSHPYTKYIRYWERSKNEKFILTAKGIYIKKKYLASESINLISWKNLKKNIYKKEYREIDKLFVIYRNILNDSNEKFDPIKYFRWSNYSGIIVLPVSSEQDFRKISEFLD